MKLAVLADIHANYVALETVAQHLDAWQPDMVVIAGDVVNRGPRPVECLRFVQSKQQTEGWLTVRGNHEDFVISCGDPDAPNSGPQHEIYRTGYWTYQQLNGNVDTLRQMPFQQNLSPPNAGDVCITHASMRGNRDGIYPETQDDELRQQIQPPADLFCVGHTHRPLIRRIDDTLVVNVGAVGLPFDGDRRASYAQLVWQHNAWQANIIRLAYDWQQTEQDFFDSGFMDNSGGLAPLILDEFHTARSRLYQWGRKYESAVLAQELTLAESVQKFRLDSNC